MNKKLVIAAMLAATVGFFAIIGFSVSQNVQDEKDIQLLHVIMRHGQRTPASTYPNDPYINETWYPIGWGQLTNNGKLMLFNSGKFLRERYDKFLGSHYTPDLYYTQSTDVDRTKASMQLVNAGLWPPDEELKWGPLDWQPIPIHSEPLSQDMLLLVRKPCAQYHLELERLIASDEIQEKLKENEETFREVSRLSGQEIKTFDDAQDIYSTLLAEEGLNKTLPDWTERFYPDKLLKPTIFSYVLNAYNDKLKRLKGGVFLKKILGDWSAKAGSTIKPKERKAFLYGGHDSTIANLLSALNVWDPQMPGYGIMIMLELVKDKSTNEFGVEIFLRNSTEAAPYQLTIPGCDAFCPLDKVVELTKNVIPENWEEECRSDDPTYEPPPPGGP